VQCVRCPYKNKDDKNKDKNKGVGKDKVVYGGGERVRCLYEENQKKL
jgi:hypothetical protein